MAQLVREELTSNRRLSGADVHAALRVALEDLRVEIGVASRAAMAIAVALIVLLAGGVVAYFVLS